MTVELTATQLLVLAALALCGGAVFGIAIGIGLYSRYGRNG